MMSTVNTDQFGKVAVLLGGNGSERAISLLSGAAIVAALKAESVDAHAVDASKNVIAQLTEGQFDRAFIALHGKGGEDGVMQGMLQTMGLPYTGSGVTGSAISMDKLRSKQIWQTVGLPVIPSESIKSTVKLSVTSANQMLTRLGMKVMVKPSAEGSSLGMAKAETSEALITALEGAAVYGGDILIERWINGPEYTVSLLKGKTLPIIQIQPSREFYDYKAKYTASGTEYFSPTNLTAAEEAWLNDIALKAFAAIDCRGWGRVDFIRDKAKGDFYLLESNTVPGMTSNSLVPMAAGKAGLSFNELVLAILTTSEASDD